MELKLVEQTPTTGSKHTSAPAEVLHIRVDKGIRLATDVHLPAMKTTTGVPVILLRTPYGRRGEVDRVSLLVEAAKKKGFGVVVQDVRGRNDSNGDAVPFVNEVNDGARTVEWIAEQPWSNGTVIPYGDSYCGYTAWAAGASNHESIAAIVARVTTTDIPREWFHRDGVLRLQMNLPWLDFAFGGRKLPPIEEWRELAVKDAIKLLPKNLRHLLTSGVDAAEWETLRVHSELLLNAKAPVVHWTGWYDTLGRGQIRDYLVRARSGHTNDVLIIDPTDHEFRAEDGDAAGETHVADLMKQIVKSYEFAIGRSRRSHNRITPMGHPGTILTDQRWFLTDADYAAEGPEGGSLSAVPNALPQNFAWVDNAADAVPTRIGYLWGALRDGLPDESATHLLPQVATFTSQEHRGEQRTLLGHVTASVPTKVRDRDSTLVAMLCDVHPDGRATMITEGVTVVPPSSQWATTMVDLGYVGHTLQAGHRLRLSLTSTSYPLYPAPGEAQEAQDVLAQTGAASFLEIVDVPELTTGYARKGRAL